MTYRAFPKASIETNDLGGGVSRKVVAYCKDVMLVEVHFEKDSVGSMHQHPHTQCTYVLEGKFRFDLDGEQHVVSAGDSLAILPNCSHGVVCLEKGVLLDVFSPMREDFV